MNNKINKDRYYVVYMHTSPNGKRYVGITSMRPIEKRWKNGYGYKKNIHFWNAINLYGWNNFQHDFLFENLTKEEAKDKFKNIDLSDLEDFRPHIKSIIKDNLKEPVVEVDKAPTVSQKRNYKKVKVEEKNEDNVIEDNVKQEE